MRNIIIVITLRYGSCLDAVPSILLPSRYISSREWRKRKKGGEEKTRSVSPLFEFMKNNRLDDATLKRNTRLPIDISMVEKYLLRGV